LLVIFLIYIKKPLIQLKFIQTFESYLKGARAPLYHFTYHSRAINIIKDDKLKCSSPSRDKRGKGRSRSDQLKSISLTRNASFSGMGSSTRISLDVDKLIKDGYIPYPIDEIGAAMGVSKRGWGNPKSDITRKFLSYTQRTIQHNLKNMPKKVVDLEYEYEERIYKNIENVGKYILYIDINKDSVSEDMKEYIKKYPHIVVRKLSYKNVKVGDRTVGAPKQGYDEILCDINSIEKEEEDQLKSIRIGDIVV